MTLADDAYALPATHGAPFKRLVSVLLLAALEMTPAENALVSLPEPHGVPQLMLVQSSQLNAPTTTITVATASAQLPGSLGVPFKRPALISLTVV